MSSEATIGQALGRAPDTERWFKRFRRGTPSEVRLFCLHHAGGTAALFRGWPHLLPPEIELIAVQFPGRGDRYRERPPRRMSDLVDALLPAILPRLDRPYAFFGLSMGAKSCWALTHALREQDAPLPLALYLASAAAPALIEGRTDWDELDDAELVDYLNGMGGTPPELLEYPDLLAILLPTLRADLLLIDTFRFAPAKPLDLPIRAFAGVDDVEGPPERMERWREETNGPFTLDRISGGHFFDGPGLARVAGIVAEDLLAEVERFS